MITNDISARFLRGQLGFLTGRGFEIHVGTALSDPPAEFDEGVVLHQLAFERQPHLVRDVRSIWMTWRLIRHLRPDIVNASTPKAGLLGIIAAWLARVPRRIYVVRGLRFETLTGIRRRFFRLLERLATACATDVIFNSPSLLSTARRERVVGPGKGSVLGTGSGNGIDLERFARLPDRGERRRVLGLERDAYVVGFVGRLTRDKGIVDLVGAFAGDNDVTVLLVGDEETGDPLSESTCALVANASNIVHVAWVDDVRNMYPAMDVLAFPSYREGLPNVPLEAQLCGVPVVAYAATGTVDALDDRVGGRLVPVGDVAALRDEVRALLVDEAERNRMRTAGRAWVADRFDQQVVWQHLYELYGSHCEVDGETR